MSILKDFINLKLKEKYINILFILILPFFVIGQFYFKIILIMIVFSSIFIFGKKIFFFEKNFLNVVFLLLLSYLMVNSIFISSYYYLSNTRFLTFSGIILFFFVTNYLIRNEILKLKLIFKIYTFFLIFILFDTLYQIIFLKDFFGYHYMHGYQRFSGPFGDEFILGVFLSFFLIPSFLFLSDDQSYSFVNKILFLLLFLFSIYIALKTGERIAFATIILQIILSIFLFNFRSTYFFVGILSALIVFFTVIVDKSVKGKYQHFYNLIFQYQNNYIEKNISNNDSLKKKNINSISFFNTQSGAHFLTAYEIWKNYPIFGVGVKNFRNESKNEKYSNIKSHQAKYRAATHPHNYQLEILSETGLVGFFLFNMVFITLIFNFIKKLRNKNLDLIFLKIFMVVVLSKYFPFKTDSSVYSSSLGLLFWIFLIFAIASYNKSSKF